MIIVFLKITLNGPIQHSGLNLYHRALEMFFCFYICVLTNKEVVRLIFVESFLSVNFYISFILIIDLYLQCELLYPLMKLVLCFSLWFFLIWSLIFHSFLFYIKLWTFHSLIVSFFKGSYGSIIFIRDHCLPFACY